MLLTQLGIPRLWGSNPEACWGWARMVACPITRLIAPSYGYGVDRIPVTGGGVVAVNHFAEIDPTLIGCFSTRTLYYMAKIELLDVPVAGEILRWCGAFAVRRGEGDRESIRVARWAVREGHMVGVFAEGTRQRFGYPGPVQPGAVMLAVQEDVPIVPCGIDSFNWSPANRRPCAVVWGAPISLDVPRTGKGYKEGAAIVEQELVRLWRLAAQAAADRFPEVLPDGARRHGLVWPSQFHAHPELPPWPTEEWAAGPLGPVYRRNGS